MGKIYPAVTTRRMTDEELKLAIAILLAAIVITGIVLLSAVLCFW